MSRAINKGAPGVPGTPGAPATNWPLVLLRLGRVSNLPTVWSNVLAGSVLAASLGAKTIALADTAWLMLAISAFYCGGMFLNDAFDSAIDARERPNRPIPAGQISARMVFGLGFLLEALGIALLFTYGMATMLLGVALAGVILLYNVWHKGNVLSPLIMGVCRALVYFVAAAATLAYLGTRFALPVSLPASLPVTLLIAASAMWAHVVGLTYAAKQENLNRLGSVWPLLILALPLLLVLAYFPVTLAPGLVAMFSALALANMVAVRILMLRAKPTAVPQAVAQLIAAISLLDGLLIAALGAPWPALLFCVGAYITTRIFQRIIPGT